MPAGYSGTPLPRKLGIKPGHRVALVKAPVGFHGILEPLPEQVAVSDTLGKEPHDVILLFAESRAQLASQFGRAASALLPAGGLWVCWPKRASGVATDLTEDVVRGVGLAAGLVDNKVCAVDETWSGLRFVIRLIDRPNKAHARK